MSLVLTWTLISTVVSVGFEKPVFWNYEDDGEITVRAVMEGRSDIPITVLFTTYNVHALGKYLYMYITHIMAMLMYSVMHRICCHVQCT